MDGGVIAEDDCVTKFNEFKMGRDIRYIIYRLSDNRKQIIVEKIGDKDQTYDDFLACLPENKCRYAVFSLDFKLDDGSDRSKILFVVWAPEIAPTREKMIVATSKDKFKKQLVGVGVEIQATDQSEVALETVMEKVMANIR
ncbi:cofilin/actin-depolymerizing factor [Anaeramoeba ignava]|uniref:Cofilin/actin-depolymerizing factor n=1 Tax=Anaeramoeba ignava TaxID=1746090 RepID=A0A9Q0LDH8_ANAIG|nr:cofilin/actin-depolymerizing factor [Anaeramoeba ignava]